MGSQILDKIMTDNEERRFFRINDTVGLKLFALTDRQFAALKESEEYLMVPSLDKLASLDIQIQTVLDSLTVKRPDVAQLGRLLDEKLQYIMENSAFKIARVECDDFPQKRVDISACGIAFTSSQSLKQGSFVDLELVLAPNRQYLKLLGKVVSCDVNDSQIERIGANDEFVLRIDYVEVSEAVQEFLIQHLVKRQGALLKASRNPPQPG